MNALVLRGFGLHCFNESFLELKKFHSSSYIYDLRFPDESLIEETKFIIIPGGFSFGDELGAGFMFSQYLKIKHPHLYSQICDPQCLVLGICNGFQIMSHTDIFPDVKLIQNKQEHFQYKWTKLNVKQDSF